MKGKNKIILLIILFLIAIGLSLTLFFLIRGGQLKSKQADLETSQRQADSVTDENQSSDKETEKELPLEGVVCWGDSLTAGLAGGYPKVLEDYLKEAGINIPVENEGVVSEGTTQIMVRAGVIPYKVANAVIIPAKAEPVFLKIVDDHNKVIRNFPKGKFQYTDVTLNGISGKLTKNSEKAGWNFIRDFDGESAYVSSNSSIRFNYVDRYKNYIPIIFMGTNGGFSSIEELIRQQQAILDTFPEQKNFLIIGLTHQTVVDEDKLDQELQEHWGKHFINLREYFSGQGVYDAGLKPKSSDLEQMKKGIVPDIIRTDAVHYKMEGYQVLGKYIYQRMIELGYIKK